MCEFGADYILQALINAHRLDIAYFIDNCTLDMLTQLLQIINTWIPVKRTLFSYILHRILLIDDDISYIDMLTIFRDIVKTDIFYIIRGYLRSTQFKLSNKDITMCIIFEGILEPDTNNTLLHTILMHSDTY